MTHPRRVKLIPPITDRMVAVGTKELGDFTLDADLADVVKSVYSAMEYERLASLGQLSGLFDNSLKI
jgi:hypothetical protein